MDSTQDAGGGCGVLATAEGDSVRSVAPAANSPLRSVLERDGISKDVFDDQLHEQIGLQVVPFTQHT